MGYIFLLVLVLQFSAQYFARRCLGDLPHESKMSIFYYQKTILMERTESTTSIPPLNHLYLLKFALDQSSNSFIDFCTPFSLASSLNTSHALGTFSSDVRPPETPATQTSTRSLPGCMRKTSSISVGETCTPETLRVSFMRSMKLHRFKVTRIGGRTQ